jgi:hypothetical protein
MQWLLPLILLIYPYGMHQMLNQQFWQHIFWLIFCIGGIGLMNAQFLFSGESSYFDGLMTRRISVLDILRSKYVLFVLASICIALLVLPTVFLGYTSWLLFIAIFFYSIGFVFFLAFQNCVYNKAYFDLWGSAAFNTQGTSGSTQVVIFLVMFVAFALPMGVHALFGDTVATYFMLAVGLLFTATSGLWLKWIYRRFMARRYANMEGFRSNG